MHFEVYQAVYIIPRCKSPINLVLMRPKTLLKIRCHATIQSCHILVCQNVCIAKLLHEHGISDQVFAYPATGGESEKLVTGLKNGQGGQTNCKPLQRHDHIDFPSLSKEGISTTAAESKKLGYFKVSIIGLKIFRRHFLSKPEVL